MSDSATIKETRKIRSADVNAAALGSAADAITAFHSAYSTRPTGGGVSPRRSSGEEAA